MQKTTAIRWHSRAGQGAITAASALAEILGRHGKHVQCFPDFGAEKRGAPVLVFNRVADAPIHDVSKPAQPNIAVLLDPSLVASGEVPEREVLHGLFAGMLLVNTTQTEMQLARDAEGTVFTVPASEIAVTEIGRDIPNVPILGALVKIGNFAPLASFSKELEDYLSKSLAPKVVEGNLKAFARGYHEVRRLK